VDAGPGRITTGPHLREGSIYTLITVTNEFSELACRVREMPLYPDEFVLLSRFRPLVDDEAQERDAAMFRKLLIQNTPELVE
jgi:hypothetical protein